MESELSPQSLTFVGDNSSDFLVPTPFEKWYKLSIRFVISDKHELELFHLLSIPCPEAMLDTISNISLVIADDHPMTLLGLRALFDSEAGFRVLATTDNGADTIRTVREFIPDILLLDISMPIQDGLSVVRELYSDSISCKTILHTYQIEDQQLIDAMRWGVQGIVLKTLPPSTLLEAVRNVYAGKRWLQLDTIGQAFVNSIERESRQKRAYELLTPRELEVVRIVAQGARNKAISERLHIQEGTVRIHLHNIYEKLGLDGRGALIAYAQQNKLT